MRSVCVARPSPSISGAHNCTHGRPAIIIIAQSTSHACASNCACAEGLHLMVIGCAARARAKPKMWEFEVYTNAG